MVEDYLSLEMKSEPRRCRGLLLERKRKALTKGLKRYRQRVKPEYELDFAIEMTFIFNAQSTEIQIY